jgi:serine/threonine-protein kinase
VSGPTVPGDGERYRFESRIATGGMGEVWRATDTVLGRRVAVKVLKSEYAGDRTFRSRFETEARNAAALHHPNVASVFDFGELPPDAEGTRRAFLVMELVEGEPLSALLRGGEPMPPATAADLLAQAADGLAAAHDLGIVHRDVKPANLLVTPDGTVKITDFGIARAANAAALTQTGQVIGTPQYLSPEQAEGKPVTAASDVYSLGVVLYECLAGRRPFDGDSPIATALAHLRQEPPPLSDDVPEPMRATVLRALAKDPAARFATVRDLAAALRGRAVPAAAAVVSGAEQATQVQAAVPVTGPVTAMRAPRSEPLPEAWTGEEAPPRVPAPPPGGADEGPRRGSGWLPWAAAAVVALLLVLGIARLLGSGEPSDDPGTGPTSPSATSSATRSSTPSPTRTPSATRARLVTVRERDYLGRPRDEARTDLRGLGLRVVEKQVANPGGKEQDTVAGVSPSGRVEVGSTVTLSFFGAPPPTASPTTSPPTPSSSTTPTGSGGPSPSASPSGSTGGGAGASTGPSAGPSQQPSDTGAGVAR